MSFAELVETLSETTGQPKEVVEKVLRAFATESRRVVLLGERVKLPKFGSFYRAVINGNRKVRFHQSRERDMEKLGVVLDDEKSKTASAGKGCPSCGSQLEKSDYPKCPRCGTAPFEKKNK